MTLQENLTVENQQMPDFSAEKRQMATACRDR